MLPNEVRAIPPMAQHFRLHGLQMITSEMEKVSQTKLAYMHGLVAMSLQFLCIYKV